MASNSARRLCLAAVAALAAELPASAFENQCSHPEMVRKAVSTLAAPGYGELSRYTFDISTGSYKEDLELNVIHHFYNPRNDQPLRVAGANAFLALFNESARSRAFRFYQGAIGAYGNGPNGRKGAYELLGRAAHLLQDVHQPSHVHNDPHVPENTRLEILGAGYEGLDAAQLESLVESGCPSVVPGASTGSFVGRSFEDFFTAEAITTYRMTALSGQLSTATVGTTGFVRIGAVDILARFVRPTPGFSDKCRTQPHWELRIDPDRPLCYNPAIRYDGPARGGYDNDWWELLPDGDIRTFLTPGQHFYIEASTDPLTREVTLPYVQALQDDHLPRAVANTAVLLKMFASEVDGRPPFLGLTKPNGDPLPSLGWGYVAETPDIVVAALDEGFPGFPPSGIYRLQVVRVPSEQVAYENAIANGASGEVVRSVSGLTDGSYEVRAYDGLGNVAIKQLAVVAVNSGAKPVEPADPDPNAGPEPPTSEPTAELGVEIDANSGEFGEACAGPGNLGYNPVNVRTSPGTEPAPYPEPAPTLCVTWACSSPGTYDIPINFLDARGIWARTHTIHCRDVPPKIKICTAGQPCIEVALPANFDLANSTITAAIQEGENYFGRGDACPPDGRRGPSIAEQIGGGQCSTPSSQGFGAIRWARDYPNATVAAAGMFYDPPANADFLRSLPFTVNFSLNGGIDLGSFTYPVHSLRGATVRLPAMGQPAKSCAEDGMTCLASGGSISGPHPPWGKGPPPTPQPNTPAPRPRPYAPAPPPDPMLQAAAALGRAILGGTIRIGNAAMIFGQTLTLTGSAQVPPYQPTVGAEICRWTGSTWGCEGPASATCSGGTCVLQADLVHASTWAFLAPLPAFYPDLTAPTLTLPEISQNGADWKAPGALIQTTNPFVRMTARDPPSGVELISGLAVSTSPLPFASDPTLILHLHLDEGAGSQLVDLSPYNATGTINIPVWVPGRFGTALEFNSTPENGQLASAPVDTRLDSGPFSIEAWVYPTLNVNNQRIATKGNQSNRFFDFLTVHGRLQASVGDGSVAYTVTASEALPLNEWSLVGMSFDGTKLRIFSNGEQKDEVAARYVGSDPGLVIGSLWKGRIDELRILKRAISRAEAALDYRRGFAAYATADGGRTWKLAAQHDSGATVEGQPGPAVLSASGFALARSTYANIIEFAAGDVEGYFGSATLPVSVAPPDTTPLAFSAPEISTDTSAWYPLGVVPKPGPVDFRVAIKDPALGGALRSGIATSTEAAPFAPDVDTVFLLHLDETSGAPLDSSANGLPVTAQNGPGRVAGRFGGAFEFNGADSYQYLVPSGGAALDVPDWTVSLWVYPTATDNSGIFTKLNSASAGFDIWTVSRRPRLRVFNTAVGEAAITAPDVLPLNAWTALTATSDRNFFRIYVNGELKVSAPGYMTPNSAAILIGANNQGNLSWKGRLDEVRYMSKAQSPEEVLLDYRRGFVALFSADGGTTWSVPAASYGAAVSGDLEAVLTVSSVTLADSLTGNRLQVIAEDAAGHTTSATYILPAAANAAAPASPVIVSTRLAAGGAAAIAWEQAPGEVPVAYTLYRATEAIASLAGLLPVATTSGLSVLDAPAPELGDVFYYAVTATNLQGKVSAPSASMETLFDRTPPVTSLVISGSSAAALGSGEKGWQFAMATDGMFLDGDPSKSTEHQKAKRPTGLDGNMTAGLYSAPAAQAPRPRRCIRKDREGAV